MSDQAWRKEQNKKITYWKQSKFHLSGYFREATAPLVSTMPFLNVNLLVGAFCLFELIACEFVKWLRLIKSKTRKRDGKFVKQKNKVLMMWDGKASNEAINSKVNKKILSALSNQIHDSLNLDFLLWLSSAKK